MPRLKSFPKRTAHILDAKWRSNDVILNEEVEFSSLLLSERVLKGLHAAGYRKPSPIQLESIPFGRYGRDLFIQAKSGTGKTLVFTIIALEMLREVKCPQVLVLAPTREIAFQIREVIQCVGAAFKKLTCSCFIGGIPLEQDRKIAHTTQIVVGTPGRIRQLILEGVIPTKSIRLFIVDEADVLLQHKSFDAEIQDIFSSLPIEKQVIASSATYPDSVKKVIRAYFRDPFIIRLQNENLSLLGTIHYIQEVKSTSIAALDYKFKLKVLEHIFEKVKFSQCLVFSNSISKVPQLSKDIKKLGYSTTYISSAKEQADRLTAISALKHFKCKVLVCTDLTSRGIDAENVNLVINFDSPNYSETYLHRVGRAGRYGSRGVAITFVTNTEVVFLKNLAKQTGFIAHSLPDPLPENLLNFLPKVDYSNHDLSYDSDSELKNVSKTVKSEGFDIAKQRSRKLKKTSENNAINSVCKNLNNSSLEEKTKCSPDLSKHKTCDSENSILNGKPYPKNPISDHVLGGKLNPKNSPISDSVNSMLMLEPNSENPLVSDSVNSILKLESNTKNPRIDAIERINALLSKSVDDELANDKVSEQNKTEPVKQMDEKESLSSLSEKDNLMLSSTEDVQNRPISNDIPFNTNNADNVSTNSEDKLNSAVEKFLCNFEKEALSSKGISQTFKSSKFEINALHNETSNDSPHKTYKCIAEKDFNELTLNRKKFYYDVLKHSKESSSSTSSYFENESRDKILQPPIPTEETCSEFGEKALEPKSSETDYHQVELFSKILPNDQDLVNENKGKSLKESGMCLNVNNSAFTDENKLNLDSNCKDSKEQHKQTPRIVIFQRDDDNSESSCGSSSSSFSKCGNSSCNEIENSSCESQESRCSENEKLSIKESRISTTLESEECSESEETNSSEGKESSSDSEESSDSTSEESSDSTCEESSASEKSSDSEEASGSETEESSSIESDNSTFDEPCLFKAKNKTKSKRPISNHIISNGTSNKKKFFKGKKQIKTFNSSLLEESESRSGAFGSPSSNHSRCKHLLHNSGSSCSRSRSHCSHQERNPSKSYNELKNWKQYHKNEIQAEPVQKVFPACYSMPHHNEMNLNTSQCRQSCDRSTNRTNTNLPSSIHQNNMYGFPTNNSNPLVNFPQQTSCMQWYKIFYDQCLWIHQATYCN